MIWDSWIDKWEKTCEAIRRLGGESEGFAVANKATEDKVTAVENKIGMKLLDVFRRIVLEFASGVDFEWRLPDELKLPQKFRGIFAGEFTWNLKDIPEINESKEVGLENAFLTKMILTTGYGIIN
jgi:hypothetical protein